MKKATDSKKKEPVKYLTKRMTASAARRGFREAAKETMEVMGYNVVARDGYIVKIDKDDNVIEVMEKMPNYDPSRKVVLD